jgi:hypothetical protein
LDSRQKIKGPHMRADPAPDCAWPRHKCMSVVAGSQDGDKQRGFMILQEGTHDLLVEFCNLSVDVEEGYRESESH